MPVTGCRVSSSAASKRTLKRRSDELSRLQSFTSCGDFSAQFQAEIRALSKEQQEDLLQGIHLPVVIPTEQALAMKADMAIPWNKLRVIRRY